MTHLPQSMLDLLPTDQMPRLRARTDLVRRWWSPDDEATFRSNGGHPIYGENDIEYRYNSYGYRCPEFDRNDTIKVVSIGCSHTEGIGLPQSAIFHEVLCQRLREELQTSIVNWNLSCGGSSNEYILRTLIYAERFLNPDLVIINFTYHHRREYVSPTGELRRFFPTGGSRIFDDPPVWNGYEDLVSEGNDLLNFIRCFRVIERLLEKRRWVYSSCPMKREQGGGLQEISRRANFAGFLTKQDDARDYIHYGPESHRALADRYRDILVRLNLMPELATLHR